MRHFLTSLLLVVSVYAMAQTDDCKVPLSVVERNLTGLPQYNTSHKIEDPKTDVERYYMKFFDNQGFNTDLKYARITLCEDFIMVDKQFYRLFRVVDMQENVILFSNQLDTVLFPGTRLRSSNWEDIKDHLPRYRKMADSLRTTIMDFYEPNTRNVIRSAKKYASDGDHKAALYVLAQYPPCCHSYPQVKDFTMAVFKDYMKKDHNTLLKIARRVWKYCSSDVDARFVVALLGSEQLTDKEQKTADKLLRKVAKEYPDVDIDAKEDYAFVPELKAIVINEVRNIAVEYSYSDELLENPDFVPKNRN